MTTKNINFESIWIAKNVNYSYSADKVLSDDEYLEYKRWEDINTEAMYLKHLPNVKYFRGKNPNIIFHGGCLGCLSQRLYGIERCKGCQYFKCDWSKDDLKVEGEISAKMSSDELKKILGLDNTITPTH